jgi:hypothetical protein
MEAMPIEFSTSVHRYSTVFGVVPTAAELYPGELAVNLADGKLFTLTHTGQVIDLTKLNSKIIVSEAQDNDFLIYNVSTGQFAPERALDVLDGGTY